MKTSFDMNRSLHPPRITLLRQLSVLLALLGLGVIQSAQAQAHALTSLWSIAPKTNTFCNNDGNLSRGIAYNPASGHLLVVSRAPIPDFGTNIFGTNGVYILDGSTGVLLGKLPYDTNVIGGGNFAVSMIGVTDDGVIYVGNLTAAPANGPFKLYRWANENAQPVKVYEGDPSGGFAFGTSPQRYGDSLALRGTGAGTQILLGTFNQTVGLLRTADGTNFSATFITTGTAPMAASDSRWGIAWGDGDTFWVKQASTASLLGNLRKMSLDLVANTATIVANIPLPTTLLGGPLDVDNSRNLMAIIDTTSHALRLYDISDPSNPTQQDTTKSFPTSFANGNYVGSVALRNGKLFALESNNGILAYSLSAGTASAPTITTQPAGVTLWEGAKNFVFTNSVGGTPPFTYQWRFGGVDIPGATSRQLLIPSVSYPQAGAYSVMVSNSAGSVTSSSATLTVTPANASAQVTNIWNVQAGTRPYLTYRPVADSVAGYRDYGMAINPVTTNIIVVTRLDPTNMIAVLDINGNHLRYIDYSGLGIPATGLPMNKVDVADDGTIYVCNYAGSGATFNIYGFGDDSGTTSDKWVAFSGDPANGQTGATNSWGYTLSARGSGLNTELLVGSTATTLRTFAILKPNASYAFSSTLITVGTDAPAGFCRMGLDWGPQPNTVWAKTASGNLYVIEYDLASGSGYVKYSYPQTTSATVLRAVPSSFTGLKYDPASGLLAGLRNGSPPSPVSVMVYEASNPDAAPFLVDQELFPTYNGDIEFQGTVDFAKGYLVALGVNNGLMAFKVNSSFVSIPTILTQPASAASYRGTPATFSVVADSASGLNYEWYFNGQLIANANEPTLNLPSVQTNNAGMYTVRVLNAGGYRESAPATLSVIEPYESAQMTNIWSLLPGSRPYLNANYNEYGMAFNPTTSNLLVVSVVSGSPMIGVLDAITGEDKHTMDVSALAGNTKLAHKIDVADDGVVYAGNLTTTASSNPFKVYRWANDAASTIATVAFEGDPTPTVSPNKGCGLTFDVRGAGANTEILVGMGVLGTTTNTVSILKTTDGVTFTANEIKVAGAPNGFSRLGLCFSAGNTFWAKAWRDEASALGKLYLVQYDLATKTGTILKTYQTTQVSSTITTLAYNDSLKLLGGIATDTQKSVMMYGVADLEAGPQLRDQELFPSYNSSIEANGDLDYGGNTYLFALNENNGIMAFRIDASYMPPTTSFKILGVTHAAGSMTLTWQAVNGAKYQVQRAASVSGGWENLGAEVTATGSTASYTDSSLDPNLRFYRVLAK